MTSRFETVDEYISSFPPDVQELLEELRKIIHSVIPDASERISYGMPAIAQGGKDLLGFAGWKHHIALYPVHRMVGELEDQVAPYRSGKATLRFPLREPLPHATISEVVTAIVERRSVT